MEFISFLIQNGTEWADRFRVLFFFQISFDLRVIQKRDIIKFDVPKNERKIWHSLENFSSKFVTQRNSQIFFWE